MGSGGDGDQQPQGDNTSLPPAYQEKEPLPPEDPVVIVERHEPPVIVQHNHVHCKKRKGRCCCYCCTVLIVLILCLTVLPIAIVYMTKDLWAQPFVDIRFADASSRSRLESFRAGETVVIKCDVEMSSRVVPLVQWFHDANEDENGDSSGGYKLFAVHNKVHDAAYKSRFDVIKTETGSHRIKYDMVIRDVQPHDAGRYACQVPKTHHGDDEFLDEFQESSGRSSSSSSSDDDDDDDHDDDEHHGCWYKKRRNDYIYLDVTV